MPFLSKEIELKSVLLDCTLIIGSHTGQNLATEIKRILQEWELDNKVILGVSDNASNIISAFDKYLLLDHFGCYAHSLNLTVQNSLELCHSTISKIKRIVLHFNKSTISSEKLLNYQLQNNSSHPKKLMQSVPTRWNSVYYMFKRFVELKDCIRATIAIIDTDLPVITPEEWDTCSQLSEILEPFEEVTRAISGENYLTGSMPIVLTKALFIVCDQLSNQPFSELPRRVVDTLIFELNKRFGNLEANNKLTLCTFLDPSFKHHYFSEETTEAVKRNFIHLLVQEIHKSNPGRVDVSTNQLGLDENQSTSAAPPQNNMRKISVWKAVDSVVDKKRTIQNPSNKSPKRTGPVLGNGVARQKRLPHELVEGTPTLFSTPVKNITK